MCKQATKYPASVLQFNYFQLSSYFVYAAWRDFFFSPMNFNYFLNLLAKIL